jgi:protein translocase SecG subunit
VLLQSSDEDSLSGIGANANQPNLSARRTSLDFITKVTMSLGVLLMINSFILASISTRKYAKENSKIKNYMEENREKMKKSGENTESVTNESVLLDIIENNDRQQVEDVISK